MITVDTASLEHFPIRLRHRATPVIASAAKQSPSAGDTEIALSLHPNSDRGAPLLAMTEAGGHSAPT
jgi:hypothetical protein